MPGNKSKTMDSGYNPPKKLRKILPRPRNPQVVIINQQNVKKNANAKEPPKLRKLLPHNTPPPLITNAVKNNDDLTLPNLPNRLPLNNSLPPLAVINQQGVKVNVVKAVWVPNSSVQTHDMFTTEISQANASTPVTGKYQANSSIPVKGKSPEGTEVISECDDSELCCRLCGKTYPTKSSVLDIFGSEGQTENLLGKVRVCLPITIKQSDKLPTTVCKECTSILDLSFKFIITALKTDQQLRDKLTRKRKNSENVKSAKGTVSPNQREDSLHENSEFPHFQPGHPNFDHTYILRGKEASHTGAAKKNASNESGPIDTTDCALCGKSFHAIEAFLQHVETDHVNDSSPEVGEKQNTPDSSSDKNDADEALSDISLMNCFKCKEICLDDEDLQFHLNYECVVCDVCGLKNRSRRSYVLHLKKHHEITFEEIRQGTDKLANKKDNVKLTDANSKKDGKSEGDETSNDTMGGDFGVDWTDSESKNGDENDVSKNKEFECLVCHRTFVNYVNFTKHRKLHDPWLVDPRKKKEVFKCDVCPRSYNRKDNLLKHKKLHRPREMWRYDCCICREKFETPRDVSLHQKVKHSLETESRFDRKYICGYCGKCMSSKTSVIEHERIHTGDKPHVCGSCGRCFRTKTNLYQHVAVHTRQRNYLCPTCGKGFSRKAFVRQHLRTHTGEKPFACDVCGMQFSQSGDMKRHRKRHDDYGDTKETISKRRKLDNGMMSKEVKDPLDIKSEEVSSNSDFGDTGRTVSATETVALDNGGGETSGMDSVAMETSGMDSVAMESSGMDSVATETSGMESVATETSGMDSVATETTGMDSVAIETSRMDSVAIETSGMDSVAIETSGMDSVAIETSGMDSVFMETVATDTFTCEVCLLEFQDLEKLRDHRFVDHGQEYQEVEREFVEEEFVEDTVAGEEVKQYVLVVPI